MLPMISILLTSINLFCFYRIIFDIEPYFFSPYNHRVEERKYPEARGILSNHMISMKKGKTVGRRPDLYSPRPNHHLYLYKVLSNGSCYYQRPDRGKFLGIKKNKNRRKTDIRIFIIVKHVAGLQQNRAQRAVNYNFLL